LLNAETLEVAASYDPLKGTPAVHSVLGELYLPLEGLKNVDAERTRLLKEQAAITGEVEMVELNLGNPNFAQKAPPAVLQEHEKRLSDWQAKLRQVQASLDALNQ
jgi:valyl-tRNA synthetase